MTRGSFRTRSATGADIASALEVWRLSNAARGRPPDEARVARVRTKFTDPKALLVVTLDRDDGGNVVGMALAEPGRDLDGAGDLLPELCHVSLVFVRPDRWGQRIGVGLLDAIAAHAVARGHRMLQLWTRQSNQQALRLYRRAGFELTGRTSALRDGDPILHLLRKIQHDTDRRRQ